MGITLITERRVYPLSDNEGVCNVLEITLFKKFLMLWNLLFKPSSEMLLGNIF